MPEVQKGIGIAMHFIGKWYEMWCVQVKRIRELALNGNGMREGIYIALHAGKSC